MTDAPSGRRSDIASRVIRASPQALYRTLLDPVAVATWRPPQGMRCVIHAFDAREGGRFRMALIHAGIEHATPGKTSAHVDLVEGRFRELVPDRRVVEIVAFESDDPAFAGAMTITTTLTAVAGGTEVTIRCDEVPPGIGAADHAEGMASTLANLAAFTERP